MARSFLALVLLPARSGDPCSGRNTPRPVGPTLRAFWSTILVFSEDACMANDAKIRVQKIQAKIDSLKKKREKKLARADGEFDKIRREATSRHNKSYRQVMDEYDPKLAKLEEQRKTADREARQVWEELQKPKRG